MNCTVVAGKRVAGFAALLVSVIGSAAAPAAEPAWPSQPIRLIVPAGAGGSADARARWAAQRLGERLGQTLIVDNRPGAGGNLGTELGAHAPPDGYTLVLIHQGTMTVNPHLYRHAAHDALKDLVPIARLGSSPMVLAVNPASPAQSTADLIRAARANPGSVSFGSPGFGTPPHMAGELFRRSADIDVLHVPYRGGGQSIGDVLAGQVSFTIEGVVSMLPLVKAGKLRALAVTSANRMAQLPQVPTLAEAGLPGAEFITWTGIAAPAGTPAAIVNRLSAEIARIYDSPEGIEYLSATGSERHAESPQEFAADIAREHARWGRFVHDTGLHVE